MQEESMANVNTNGNSKRNEYLIRFPADSEFVLFSDNGTMRKESLHPVSIAEIESCGYDYGNGKIGEIKYYCVWGYIVGHKTRAEWYSILNPEFERQFPYFPYIPAAKARLNICIANMSSELREAHAQINSMKRDIEKLNEMVMSFLGYVPVGTDSASKYNANHGDKKILHDNFA